jgi:multicomponent Na+:H+ antiporter subunit D
MSQQFPALIIIAPLIGAFIISAAGWINKKYCLPILITSFAVSVYAAVGLLAMVMKHQEIVYRFGGWAPPWGIVYKIDYLNSLVLIVIPAVGLINAVTCHKHILKEFPNRIGPFYTLYALFVTGLIGIVATGDAFNLYVLLEIASLTGYALIGMGKGPAPLASLNYVFMGTIGASFYLLGIGYLYLVTGSLNMADLASLLPAICESKVVLMAIAICMAGLFIKMAMFPLHGWMPNAYTHAPSAAASVIAPLTTKVMIYVMIRIVLYVFTPAISFEVLDIGKGIVWLAVIAIVAGSFLALSQTGLKKMLAYIIVAEVGYMVGGFWIGNRMAMTGAILHIVNDAMMTLCVFLAAGAITYKIKIDSFENMAGLFRKMPFTMSGLVVGALAIIGVPPTCGFFSKWYLISGGIAAGHYAFVGALIFSSLINVVLFFRIFEIAYYQPFSHGHGRRHYYSSAIDEAPLDLVVPLLATAGLLIVLGLYTGDIVDKVIRFAIPPHII